MKCVRPYVAPGKFLYPCGNCDACRANRRRIWTHRIMLESFQHEHNSFVTLTYKNEPEDRSLYPEHLRDWLKRFRKRVSPSRIRYFAVGEYGDQSGRPHYHVALFGWPGCVAGSVRARGDCPCLSCSVVRETWGYGHVMVAELSFRSAAYVAGYVVKKMTRTDDLRLNGRWPEFARMSLRPGIGADATWDLASAVMKQNLLEKLDDVPSGLRHGSKEWPLGRYLRRLLRERCGLSPECPPEVLQALRTGLLPVFIDAEVKAAGVKGPLKRLMVEDHIHQMNEQYGRNVAARGKKRGSL